MIELRVLLPVKAEENMYASRQEWEVFMTQSDYIVIKAKEDGVKVIGLTRGDDTKFHHTEKLDNGEVMIAQFTNHTSAMKIRGEADVHTANGIVTSGKGD